MRLVFMSACLQYYDRHRTFKHKLGSELKISGKETLSRKHCFSKLKCRQFLYKSSSLYILSDRYTSKNMIGTKNVRYSGIFKASKNTC